jgi:hypothetical protein
VFLSQLANPCPQSPLKLLPLHQEQFGGTLFKRILLIRRAVRPSVVALGDV